jgi:hypothetical protein
MGDVINLNRFRKKKAREEKERRAETNRRLHGRTKAERAHEEVEKKRLEEKLDGAFLVRDRVRREDVPMDEVLRLLDEAADSALTLEELSESPPQVKSASDQPPADDAKK